MATGGVTGSIARDGQDDMQGYEDYLSEINDIEQGKDPEDPGEEELSKTPDEGEQELDWLVQTGYGHLANKYTQEGTELADDDLNTAISSLTRGQAAAVKKRIDTLNATIRKKQKQKDHQRTDVRDVFTQPADVGAQSEQKSSQGGPSRGAGAAQPLRRQGPNMRIMREVSLTKNRGGYAMTGDSTADNRPTTGIYRPSTEPVTMLHTGTAYRYSTGTSQSPPLSPTSQDRVRRQTTSADGLPDLIAERDILGTTHVEDLGKADLPRLRPLALIELTSLFDVHHVTYARRKAKRRLKEHGVFGVPLQTLLEHDQKRHPHLKVPLIFQKLIHFLEQFGLGEEGILRVPGSALRIKTLRQEIEDKFSSGALKWEDVRPNDAAGLLKQFLRELPVPLLTFDYLDAFAQADQISDADVQIQALTLLVILLPDVHRDTFKMLLRFLKEVVDSSNKMTMENVAMIMAPNLFLVQSTAGRQRAKNLKDSELRMAAGTSKIVKLMIKYQHLFWIVPSSMISQMRHQYETELQKKSGRDKSIMKFLGRRDKSDANKKLQVINESDFGKGVIRVQAPQMTKAHMSVQLEPSTTAGDIVSRFKENLPGPHAGGGGVGSGVAAQRNAANPQLRRNGTADELQDGCSNGRNQGIDDIHLYEIGGNIGERRLDHSTNLLQLYRVNPKAEWLIKRSL